MVTIKVDGITASITNEVWKSEDAELLHAVSVFANHLIIGYTPWPDYTLAEMAVEALGGRIIKATDPPEYVEGRVY